jgi:hypothetical protein
MITIGFSTRNIDKSFIEMLKKTSGVSNTEVIPIENNGEYSLTEVYNKILSQSKNDIVILCHDDIYFDSKNWGQKILKHFKRNNDYGILGVAGSVSLPKSAKWWEDFSKMRGIVNHEHEGKKWESKYSPSLGNQIDDVVLVDGLFIGLNKNNIKNNFNPDVKGFHFYDVDFSFRNYIEGVNIGVIYDVRITHKSIGQTNDQWEKNRELFAENNKNLLPIKIKKEVNKNSNLKILVFENDFYKCENLLSTLKKIKFTPSFCGMIYDEKIIKKLKLNNIKSFNINEPCGYKLGDGKWGFNSPNGFVPAEANKLYKISEVNFDIVHVMDDNILPIVKSLYPNSDIFLQNKSYNSEDELINDYNNFLNG